MTDPIHPARTCSFDDLITGLDQACAERLVHRRVDPKSGLALFVYTNRCVYDGTWNFSARVARGLIGGLNKRARAGLLRAVRPTNNELPGYTPSFAMSRMIENALSS